MGVGTQTVKGQEIDPLRTRSSARCQGVGTIRPDAGKQAELAALDFLVGAAAP